MAHQRYTFGFTGEDEASHREDRFSPQNEADYERLARIAAASLDGKTTSLYGVEEGFGKDVSPGGKRLYLLADPTATRLFYQDAVGSQEGESGLVTSQSAVLDLTTGATAKLDELVATVWDGTLPSRSLKGHATWSDDGSKLACVCSDGIDIHRFDRRSDTNIFLDGTRVDGTLASRAAVANRRGIATVETKCRDVHKALTIWNLPCRKELSYGENHESRWRFQVSIVC